MPTTACQEWKLQRCHDAPLQISRQAEWCIRFLLLPQGKQGRVGKTCQESPEGYCHMVHVCDPNFWEVNVTCHVAESWDCSSVLVCPDSLGKGVYELAADKCAGSLVPMSMRGRCEQKLQRRYDAPLQRSNLTDWRRPSDLQARLVPFCLPSESPKFEESCARVKEGHQGSFQASRGLEVRSLKAPGEWRFQRCYDAPIRSSPGVDKSRTFVSNSEGAKDFRELEDCQ